MTREELKAHYIRQVEQCERWAELKGEEPSGKMYEEHKLILELLEQEPVLEIKTVTNAEEAEAYPISENTIKGFEEFTKMIFKQVQPKSEGYEAKVITRGNCMMCGKELDEGLFFCKECEAKAVQGRKMVNMTRGEEAIKKLKDILAEATETDDSVCYVTSNDADALDMAIKALEQEPRWIPVSERLPEEGEDVLVSGYDTYNKKVIIARYQGEQYGFTCGLVSAWMHLPKPYKPQESEE